jgi:DNA-binding protein Fis
MVEDSEGLLNANIGASIDRLVEYLVQNDMQGVHPLIMGEIEKRLLTRTLELCNGNKGKAAKILGISRNTFHRKIQRLYEREKTEPG